MEADYQKQEETPALCQDQRVGQQYRELLVREGILTLLILVKMVLLV
jgi:hypothetical protein